MSYSTRTSPQPFWWLLLVCLLGIACQRPTQEAIEPRFMPASPAFQILKFEVAKQADVANRPYSVDALFNERVTFQLLLKGMQSGAERIFVSTNDHLDSTIFSWKGGHDGLYFFQKEKVLMSLSFLGSAKIIQDTIELISINNFLQSNNYYALSKDNSFEKFGLNDIKGYYQHSLFYALCQSNLRIEVKNDLKPPHGEKYLQIQGNASCLENGYFVGGMQFWSNLSSFYLSDWEEKNDLYFNLYVYGRANGDRIALRLMEADPETDQLKDPQNQDPKVLDCANGPYFQNKHCPCVDDSWVYEYTIEHEGWKLISIPFSQFKVSTIENVGNHGNKKFEPNRIHKIEIGLIAPSKYGAVSTGIDFPTISRNGPFDPSQ